MSGGWERGGRLGGVHGVYMFVRARCVCMCLHVGMYVRLYVSVTGAEGCGWRCLHSRHGKRQILGHAGSSRRMWPVSRLGAGVASVCRLSCKLCRAKMMDRGWDTSQVTPGTEAAGICLLGCPFPYGWPLPRSSLGQGWWSSPGGEGPLWLVPGQRPSLPPLPSRRLLTKCLDSAGASLGPVTWGNPVSIC